MRIRVFQDESAFARLFEEHATKIQRFLYRKLPSQQDVDDAFSVVWMRIWEYATATPIQHFSGLAFTIAKAVVAEFYRTRERDKSQNISEEQQMEELATQDPTAKVIAKVDMGFVMKHIDDLPEDEREAIILRHLEGYSIKHIAEYLGKTPNATSVLISRAIKKLGDVISKL